MDVETFLNLPTEEVAHLVRAAGPKVCVFPINGTRRWFFLEHPAASDEGLGETYLTATWRRQLELYRLVFDHGIDTLLSPIFGPDLLERGTQYRQLVLPGLLWCTRNDAMSSFYDAYQVRVRIYGDARRHLQDTPYASVLEAFDEIAQRTATHTARRLFFGVCAHDATETIAEIGVRFFQRHGSLPDRRQIVEAYYGEYIKPVDLFIGFDRPASYDMPLLATGKEDLYFTVSPSPYLDAEGLRTILYDHLYSRPEEPSYAELAPEDWEWMRAFYQANRGQTLGVGTFHSRFWHPTPQVKLPASRREQLGGTT